MSAVLVTRPCIVGESESRAKFQNRVVSEVLADISRARDALRKAPEVILQAIYGDPGRGFAGGYIP